MAMTRPKSSQVEHRGETVQKVIDDITQQDGVLNADASWTDIPKLKGANANKQAQALANRTQWLNKEVDFLTSKASRYKDTADAGCVRDGVTDDSAALLAFLLGGSGVVLPGVYELNGVEIRITNSIDITVSKGAVFKNGLISIIPDDDEKRITVRGNLYGVDATFVLGGVIQDDGSAVDDPGQKAVILQCGDIKTKRSVTGKPPLQISVINNSVIGNITAKADGMAPGAQGVKFNVIHGSVVGNISIDGEFSMGCEVAGNSIRACYASYKTKFGFVTVKKPAAYTDLAGHHGFYLHGAVDTEVHGVYGSGWGLVNTSNADFKTRDNQRCKIGAVRVSRLILSSDDNGNYPMSLSMNELRDVYADTAYFSVSGTGTIFNNRFINFECPDFRGSQSGLGFDGVAATFEGVVRLGSLASGNFLNVGAVLFENAKVEFLQPYFLRGNRTRARRTVFTNGLQDNPQGTNDVRLEDVSIIGEYYYNPTTGTHLHYMRNVSVSGELKTNSFDARLINADWAFVTSGENEPASANQPDNKVFRFVSYADKCYVTQSTTSPI